MDYIIPPMPPPGIAGIAGASDFFSANTHSVVRNIEAIEAAFSGVAGGWPGRVPPGAAGTSLAAGLFFVRAFAAQHLPYAGREGCPDEGRDDEEP